MKAGGTTRRPLVLQTDRGRIPFFLESMTRSIDSKAQLEVQPC
jgi:hypothetical protein